MPSVETYQPGVDLTSQGTRASHVYFLKEGLVKFVHICPDGEEGIVQLALGEYVVGGDAVLGKECIETATTVTQCKLVRYSAPEFLRKLNDDPVFAVNFARLVCRQRRELCLWFMKFRTETAREQIEALLRSWAGRKADGRGRMAAQVEFPMTRSEIAKLLSISTYYLSGILKDIEEAGLIRREKRRIWILPTGLCRPAH